MAAGVDVAAGTLILNAVKAVYGLWKENKGAEALELTNGAMTMLRAMQSDDTDHGEVLNTTGLGTDKLSYSCPWKSEISGTSTQRVWMELEAKGLVERYVLPSGRKGIRLTHFGWILNSETGKVDKVG